MKTWDATLILEIAKTAASSHLLVECVFSSTYRYCDADIPVWADTGSAVYEFQPHPVQVENIDQSGDLAVDKVTLAFSAVDLTLVSVVLGEDVSHKTVNVYFTCLDSIGKPIATEKIFSGVVTEWELTEQDLTVVLANELIAWQKKTLRTHSASCPWVFKGSECTYAGAETWCDKSYERCKQLSNSANYGGFPFLPSIKDKKIWWGRSPA